MATKAASFRSDAPDGVQHQAQFAIHSGPPSRLPSRAPSLQDSHASMRSLPDSAQTEGQDSFAQVRRQLRLQTGVEIHSIGSDSRENGRAQNTDDSDWHMRHGWDSQYTVEQLRELTTVSWHGRGYCCAMPYTDSSPELLYVFCSKTA